jgi:hypothetical protein
MTDKSGPCSHVWDWWEETMLYRQIEWSLVSCMGLVRRDHGQHHGLFSPIIFMTSGATLCLYNTMVSSHQSHTWEQGPHYLSIQHHGLFSRITYMRPGATLSVYATPWSLLTNYMHETRDHGVA